MRRGTEGGHLRWQWVCGGGAGGGGGVRRARGDGCLYAGCGVRGVRARGERGDGKGASGRWGEDGPRSLGGLPPPGRGGLRGVVRGAPRAGATRGGALRASGGLRVS